MKTMFKLKLLFGLGLLSLGMNASAVPNVWQSSYAEGMTEYSIQDKNGNTLWVVCNEGAGDDYDHSARFEMKNKSYENTDAKYPLSFLLNGKTQVAPAGTTKWRNGGNAWYEFSQGIASAKKIEVFVNNKKMTTFTPNAASIKAVAKEIASCEAL